MGLRLDDFIAAYDLKLLHIENYVITFLNRLKHFSFYQSFLKEFNHQFNLRGRGGRCEAQSGFQTDPSFAL